MPSKFPLPSVPGAPERTAPGERDLVRGATVREWVRQALDSLRTGREALDRANVFPVADSDTGTNMYLTLREAAAAVAEVAVDVDVADPRPARADVGGGTEAPGASIGGMEWTGAPIGGTEAASATGGAGHLLAVLARGALLGARGNSGIILSEYLRGWASAVADAPVWGAPEVVRGLDAAARTALSAVARPVSGTILTAARAAADEAALAAGLPVTDVVAAACAGARAATARSAKDLGVLARAGVLDAGALGLVLVLDALHRALSGDRSPAHAPDWAPGPDTISVASARTPDLPAGTMSVADGTMSPMPPETTKNGEFEVMFALSADESGSDAVAGRLRAGLQEIGESVVVVGGPAPVGGTGLWQVHVHTDDPVAAIEAGRAVVVGETRTVAGTLCDVRVRHLRVSDDAEPADRAQIDGPGVVAVTSAPGLVPDLARGGAVVLLRPDAADTGVEPPDAGTIRRGCVDTRARTVVVLSEALSGADDARIRAELAGHGTDSVEFLPATSDVQVVAALAAAQTLDDDASDDARVAAMRRTVDGVRVRRVEPAQDVDPVLDDLLAGADRTEALTVLVDRDVPEAVVEAVVSGAARRAPGVETIVLASGRSGAGVELGAEVVR